MEVRFVWTSHGTDCGTSCDDSFVLACGDAWLQCDSTELVLVDMRAIYLFDLCLLLGIIYVFAITTKKKSTTTTI